MGVVHIIVLQLEVHKVAGAAGYRVTASEVDTPEIWEFWRQDPEEESVTDHTRYDSSGEDYGYQDPATLSLDTLLRIVKDEWGSVEFEKLPQ